MRPPRRAGGQPLDQDRPVGQPGQRVVRGPVGEFRWRSPSSPTTTAELVGARSATGSADDKHHSSSGRSGPRSTPVGRSPGLNPGRTRRTQASSQASGRAGNQGDEEVAVRPRVSRAGRHAFAGAGTAPRQGMQEAVPTRTAEPDGEGRGRRAGRRSWVTDPAGHRVDRAEQREHDAAATVAARARGAGPRTAGGPGAQRDGMATGRNADTARRQPVGRSRAGQQEQPEQDEHPRVTTGLEGVGQVGRVGPAQQDSSEARRGVEDQGADVHAGGQARGRDIGPATEV